MSGPEFPNATEAWAYAAKQPNANKVGPLGRRAGLDVSEHYTNVIRFELFPDANKGSGDVANSTFDQADINNTDWMWLTER